MWRGEWLADNVIQNGWTRGAELGVCKGKTFFHVLNRCPDLHMVGVDLWEAQPGNPGVEDYTQPHWKHKESEINVRRLAKNTGRATIIKGLTVDAADQVEDGSLDFVFIDADHCYKAVIADIKAWMPKLKQGGVMTGHDINWPGVRTAVSEMYPGYSKHIDNCWSSK